MVNQFLLNNVTDESLSEDYRPLLSCSMYPQKAFGGSHLLGKSEPSIISSSIQKDCLLVETLRGIVPLTFFITTLKTMFSPWMRFIT